MNKQKRSEIDGMLERGFTATPRQLEILLDLVTNNDPLKTNPKVTVPYRCTLVRPDELVTAEFAWKGLHEKYGISDQDIRLLFYVQRVVWEHCVVLAHTNAMKARCEIKNN